jgi:predicted helicase
LEKKEIDALLRMYRIQKIRQEFEEINKVMIQKIERKYAEEQPIKEQEFIPIPYQEPIIHKIVSYLTINSKGITQLPCGTGKTFISLWSSKLLNSNTIIIGVPNVLLLDQWRKIVIKMFTNVPILLVSGSKQKEDVVEFLQQHGEKCIVITTYASSHKVLKATKDVQFKFDMKINDEVHHLTNNNANEENRKNFTKMLEIDSDKQLSLTATIKILENCDNKRDDDVIISNDNIEIFGEIIDRKTLLWAIQENAVCDYVIQTIITNEEQLEHILSKFNITEENDKRLFLSAYASLKSIQDGHSHHLLIYLNNKDNSDKIIIYVKLLLNNGYFIIRDLYYSSYHSELKQKTKTEILTTFNNSDFGIISCVYCLGEGYDNCIIDAVVFAENMSSNIRIVQSALRASRKNINDKNKKTKIILPILNRDDWMENNENPDFFYFLINNENETLGNLLSTYITYAKNVFYCGFVIEHPLKKNFLFKIKLNENNNLENILLVIEENIDYINDILNSIEKEVEMIKN